MFLIYKIFFIRTSRLRFSSARVAIYSLLTVPEESFHPVMQFKAKSNEVDGCVVSILYSYIN